MYRTKKNVFDAPSFFLYSFIKFYQALMFLGVTKLPKIKGLFNYIYRRIRNKKGVIKIRTQNGFGLYVNLSDNIISRRLIQHGCWEKTLTDVVKKILKPGMNIIDVGAHVGYYSVLFSNLVHPGGKVISFEPEPSNFKILLANLEENEIRNCSAICKAVSNISGKTRLYLDPENKGAHSIFNYLGNEKFIDVDMVKMDDVVNKTLPIDFIKIDTEGNEFFVLEGMEEIIARNKNIVIVTEFTPFIFRQTNQSPAKFIEKLKSFGFYIYSLDPNGGAMKNITSIKDFKQIKGFWTVNLLCSRKNIRL